MTEIASPAHMFLTNSSAGNGRGVAMAGDGWEVVDIQGLYDSISSDRSALAA